MKPEEQLRAMLEAHSHLRPECAQEVPLLDQLERERKALREVLEAIRGSKTFAQLSHHLQDRVNGALRRWGR